MSQREVDYTFPREYPSHNEEMYRKVNKLQNSDPMEACI